MSSYVVITFAEHLCCHKRCHYICCAFRLSLYLLNNSYYVCWTCILPLTLLLYLLLYFLNNNTVIMCAEHLYCHIFKTFTLSLYLLKIDSGILSLMHKQYSQCMSDMDTSFVMCMLVKLVSAYLKQLFHKLVWHLVMRNLFQDYAVAMIVAVRCLKTFPSPFISLHIKKKMTKSPTSFNLIWSSIWLRIECSIGRILLFSDASGAVSPWLHIIYVLYLSQISIRLPNIA